MFRRVAAIVFFSVLMLLALPVCCLAAGAESFDESSEAAEMSTSESSEAEKEKGDNSRMIYLSIGAGIVIVAVTIGVIASRDA